jgi:hypothetical protein
MGHKSEVSRRVQNHCLFIGECFRGENECTNTKIEGQRMEKERKMRSGGLVLGDIVVY